MPELKGRCIISTFRNVRSLCVLLPGVLLLLAACDSGTVLDKATREFENGNYREAIFILRHHFRKGGQRTPELLFLEGRALLALGIEAEADDSFAEIYSIDTVWAPKIAEVFRLEALSSLDRGLDARGARFIIRASNYAKSVDFGKYGSLAGKMLLDRKDYEGAIYYLSRYMEDFSDTTGAAEVMMNLGAAYEGNGETIRAMEIYRRFKETYPKSRLVSTAVWKLENLLLTSGEELRSGGETEEAENVLIELAGNADNPLVREKANFMLAGIYEARLETDKAIEFYSRVVHMNLGSSGRLVEKAKERIVELEKARSR